MSFFCTQSPKIYNPAGLAVIVQTPRHEYPQKSRYLPNKIQAEDACLLYHNSCPYSLPVFRFTLGLTESLLTKAYEARSWAGEARLWRSAEQLPISDSLGSGVWTRL
jgi:hypothetical protein